MTKDQYTADTDQLAAWLSDRRWYGEKSRTVTGSSRLVHAVAEIGGDRVDMDVVQLDFAHGPQASYLLLTSRTNPDEDAIESREFRDWLMQGFDQGRVLPGDGDARLRWNWMVESVAVPSGEAVSSRVFRGEQSNSSIVYGDAAIMKMFRKIREGINPEVEIGQFLTQHTSFTAFPRLLGAIELESNGEVTTIAAVQEYIPSVGDAWSWITDRINDPGVRPATIDAARVLGVRTAEMHVGFAAGKSDAFVPEVASAPYAEAVCAEARAELKDTIEQLERRGVGGATQLGDALQTSFDSLRELEGTMITRIHGDYHLGQVLRTNQDDFAILDFEGEPSRSLAERRAKASPLRDVAGMLRSFDYAAETARRDAGGVATEDIDEWYGAARASFLDGYESVVRENSILMRGWEQGQRTSVLGAFEMHKALYEVRYELSNRPDWLDIPLNALRRIAGDGSYH